jgi:predicted DNA-binding transcriptional regulator AlpA
MQLTKLNVSEAATSLGVSKSWLDKKRLDGGGPEYHKFGRRVLYDVDDLQEWAARNKRRHTSEATSNAPVAAFNKVVSDPEAKK